MIKRNAIERFWEKVDKTSNPNGCWIWIASKHMDGYGQINVNGKTLRAHRISYELRFGKIKKGLSVLHRCDNPACVNPDHLFLGTQSDNVEDAYRKHRMKGPKGEHSSKAKLSWDDAREIRRLAGFGKLTHRFLSKMFKMSRCQVSKIISNQHWIEP